MNMTTERKPIIEGKVKTVYPGDNVDQVIIEYHDKVTAGNVSKSCRS